MAETAGDEVVELRDIGAGEERTGPTTLPGTWREAVFTGSLYGCHIGPA